VRIVRLLLAFQCNVSMQWLGSNPFVAGPVFTA
jgi:hypothetical protein